MLNGGIEPPTSRLGISCLDDRQNLATNKAEKRTREIKFTIQQIVKPKVPPNDNFYLRLHTITIHPLARLCNRKQQFLHQVNQVEQT